jgi:hypothetical protein
MKLLLLVCLFFVGCFSINQSLGGEPHFRVVISSKTPKFLSDQLKHKDYDILQTYENTVEAILSKVEYEQLKTEFDIKIVEVASPLSKKLPNGFSKKV